MSKPKSECTHYDRANVAAARGEACEACGASAPIRVCVACGHVGCCESTRGHAKAHALSAKHPVIQQLPIRDASFTWCYACNDYLRD